jgi:hypothetical protein
MSSIKRKLALLAASAVLTVSGATIIPSAFADGSVPPGPQSAVNTENNGLLLVQHHGHGHGGSGGSIGHAPGHSPGMSHGPRMSYGHDGHGHGHHRHGHFHDRFIFSAPYFFEPYYDYDYGYDYGYDSAQSCYWDCRSYHGPRYCRYHWRSYC